MESFRVLHGHVIQQLRILRTRPAIKPRVRITEQRAFSQNTRSRTAAEQIYKSTGFTFSRTRTTPSSWLRAFRIGTRHYATAAPVSEQNLSLSQRLKKLSREYGWSALGVYLLLAVLDFPFCFLAVRLLGTDRIGHWEYVVVSHVKEWMAVVWPQGVNVVDGAEKGGKRILEEGAQRMEGMMQSEGQGKRLLEEGHGEGTDEAYGVVEHGYKEADEANRGDNASIWTQLALAYAIHKSLIFVRVPLTAAVTPKVVKTLRGWGWNIGKRPVKKTGVSFGSNSTSGSGTSKGASGTGVNTKGTGVKSD